MLQKEIVDFSEIDIKDRALKVYEFWTFLNKLKDVIRTGWLRSGISKERLESVAEHVYSTTNLAIAMQTQFGYEVDLYKVVYMIAIHEIGEAVIGDIPIKEQKEDKKIREREAVVSIIGEMISKEKILDIFDEFEERTTPEAKFAYQCDKVDCDLQCASYQEYSNDETWAKTWINGDIERYKYDDNFTSVAEVALIKIKKK